MLLIVFGMRPCEGNYLIGIGNNNIVSKIHFCRNINCCHNNIELFLPRKSVACNRRELGLQSIVVNCSEVRTIKIKLILVRLQTKCSV